ncbi:hypothetical protein K458DRAFT_392652, partial [Lentithecium fluviatile CBS 122367]
TTSTPETSSTSTKITSTSSRSTSFTTYYVSGTTSATPYTSTASGGATTYTSKTTLQPSISSTKSGFPPKETDRPSDNPSDPVNCPGKNYGGGKFLLRSHVIYGSQEFENLYIEYVDQNAGNVIPTFTNDRDQAYPAYYDRSVSSIQMYHDNCATRGLTMNLDDDNNAYSAAFITNAVGTAKMNIAWGKLIWENDRFGSWLACSNGDDVELLWWDVVTNQGIDQSKCAKIQLIVENFNDEDTL